MSVRNYCSALHNISEERRSHMTVWRFGPWFCTVQFGTFWFGASYANLRQPRIFKWQI